MARGISGVLNRTYADAIRIARTEGGRAQTEGTIQSFKAADEAGVEARWIWVATKDERTRDSHREMDGEAAEVRDGEHEWYLAGEWVRGPRLHSDVAEVANCRCTTRMEIEGLAPKLMRSKEYGVEPYMPYAEWERKHKK
jgi:SPP1 gp7 family putative phage head morphogenesis protein